MNHPAPLNQTEAFRAAFQTTLDRVADCRTEKELEDRVILPLLALLGYDEAAIGRQVKFGTKRLDVLVQSDQSAPCRHYLVIEAKAPKQSIANSSWQLRQYLLLSGSIFGLLTNGHRFRLLYNYGGAIECLGEFERADLYRDYRLLGSLLWQRNCDRVMAAFAESQHQVHDRLVRAIARLAHDPKVMSLLSIDSRQQLDQANQSRKSMIITVFNNKGGVGKTTLTINLAAALAQLGKRVLLIDIDAQANLTTGLGIDPLADIEQADRKDITHLLTEPKTTLESVTLSKRWDKLVLDVVPSHIRMSTMENQLIQLVDSDRILAKKLKNHPYDFVFIDPPPSFGKVNRISLMASAGVLVPTQLSPYPIRALEYVLSQVEEVGQFRETPLPIVGIAVSMYDRGSRSFNQSMVDDLQERLDRLPGGDQVSLFPEDTWIPRLNILSKSQDKGYPLCAADLDTDLTNQDRNSVDNALASFEALAKALVRQVSPPEA